ncbi:alpha/beta hydrolase [Calothrix sp. 336/3]|uniref:alpha/beta hydrolase n=1 Tax=Calothrix sp. 336/3 TaxID=1337936 RepID=UPI0004E3E533|nr:alpha/beta hydrolase [Calothrix sp. 336/3]AKG23622.1 serine esterase [Calothrix sp. 336/3]
MSNSFNFLQVPPQTAKTAKGLIVVLHGWGANAQDVASLASIFQLPEYHFIFPDAPYAYPYSPMGKAWYDLRMEKMYQGLPESRQLLIDWLLSLEAETGIPLSQTILSGFSQGGAMTLDVGLKLPFAGLVVMSGYLHPELENTTPNQISPVLITHGRYDEVVPLAAAKRAKTTLESMGIGVQYHEFDMGHEIRPQTIDLFRNFVTANGE